MEELLVFILADITLEEVFSSTILIVSSDFELLSSIEIGEELMSLVTTAVETFDSFKTWSAVTLPSVDNILMGVLGLQVVYNMITHHYDVARSTGHKINLFKAMLDIEKTLKENYDELRDSAQKLLLKDLPPAVKESLRKTANSSPESFWDNARLPIALSLDKLSMYST